MLRLRPPPLHRPLIPAAAAVAPPARHHPARHHLHNTPRRLSSDEPHYDPPTGNLFGVAPGQTYQKEGWEGVFYWGYCGSLALAVIAYAFKPDTSIQTWALEEARRRLEREGILEDPQGRTVE